MSLCFEDKFKRWFEKLNIGCLVLAIIMCASPMVIADSAISTHHMDVIKSACETLHPEKILHQSKCKIKMKRKNNSLLNFKLIPDDQKSLVLQHCEGLKYVGDPSLRLSVYDKCLRAKISEVEPQIIKSPPRLSIKPYIFLEISFSSATFSNLFFFIYDNSLFYYYCIINNFTHYFIIVFSINQYILNLIHFIQYVAF